MIAETPKSAPAVWDEDQGALRLASARSAALCTIVRIDGSFSRRLGAQLAIATDGEIAGSLSDGCLDAELANQARLAIGEEPRVLRYGRGSPFIDFRLPCGSGLDILIDPGPDIRLLRRTTAALDARVPAALALPIDVPDLLHERAYLPSLRLLALGVGPEADWLKRLACSYGLEFVLAGPKRGLSLGRVPENLIADRWTAIILLFHDHEWEAPLLEWAMSTPAFYIGAIGGAIARENRREFLAARGHGPQAISRIGSPIGLIEHTRDARTLALSILAEVVDSYEALRG